MIVFTFKFFEYRVFFRILESQLLEHLKFAPCINYTGGWSSCAKFLSKAQILATTPELSLGSPRKFYSVEARTRAVRAQLEEVSDILRESASTLVPVESLSSGQVDRSIHPVGTEAEPPGR